jgi:hypothetical protein
VTSGRPGSASTWWRPSGCQWATLGIVKCGALSAANLGASRTMGGRMSKRLPGGLAGELPFPHLRLTVRGRVTRLLAGSAAAGLVGALLAIAPAAPSQAACGNPVACENQLAGTPQSVWDVTSPSTAIQGFADPFSVNIGNSVNFKIESPASSYKVDIYRMGYYDGDGARLITSLTPSISVSQGQPACNTNTVTGLGARIPAACGTLAGRCWRLARSPMSPPRAGRSWTSPPRYRSPREPHTSPRITPARRTTHIPRTGCRRRSRAGR